jgi:pSer/pThr/pTyr-binding forkhead associated (FHA) protein
VSDQDIDPTTGDSGHDFTSAFGAEWRGARDRSVADVESALREVEDLPGGSALLVVIRGPGTGSWFRLDQPVASAGRHVSCDILLDDITASRRHAEFRRDQDKFSVVDMGSLNGIYVNRQLVHSAVLADGDQVQIGKFRLLFRSGGSAHDECVAV